MNGMSRAAGLEQVQRDQAGEARQVEVGQHHVPVLLERGEEGRLGIDAQRLAPPGHRGAGGPASARGRAASLRGAAHAAHGPGGGPPSVKYAAPARPEMRGKCR